MQPSAPYAKDKFRELLDLVARLRSPTGCPWDRSQKKEDIGRYLIEEAYEVLEALDGASSEGLCEELGDLLFQILFLSRIEEEAGEFDMAAVLGAIIEKMIRRHPHVFGDTPVANVQAVRANWEQIKKEVEHNRERRTPTQRRHPPFPLDVGQDSADHRPGLLRRIRLGQRRRSAEKSRGRTLRISGSLVRGK